MSEDRERRSSTAQRVGEVRAVDLAKRIGTGLKDARRGSGLRQCDVADRAGISQSYLSELERGRKPGASLLTLAECAAAVGAQLAAFVEAQPGADLPRDFQHLRRQAMLIETSAPGGWAADGESLIGDLPNPASIDVLLRRQARREAAVNEIWDWLPDGGAAIRGLARKVLATRIRLGPEWRVEGLFLLRRTARNRALVRELAPLIRSCFPASSTAWLKALTDPDAPMPDRPGFVWTSVDGKRIIAARLG